MRAVRLSNNFYFELDDFVYDKDGNEYKWEEICLVPSEKEVIFMPPTANEERQIRSYASIAFMHAVMSDHEAMSHITNAFESSGDKAINNILAKKSVEAADALIQELKRVKYENGK